MGPTAGVSFPHQLCRLCHACATAVLPTPSTDIIPHLPCLPCAAPIVCLQAKVALFKVEQLKEALQGLNLSRSGRKDELSARLLEFFTDVARL
jgi:hypothetical protein